MSIYLPVLLTYTLRLFISIVLLKLIYIYTEIYANLLAFVNRYIIANKAFRAQLRSLCDPPSGKKSKDKNVKEILDNDFVVTVRYDNFEQVSIIQFKRYRFLIVDGSIYLLTSCIVTVTTKRAYKRK